METMFVQVIIPKFLIEALNEGILVGHTGLDQL